MHQGVGKNKSASCNFTLLQPQSQIRDFFNLLSLYTFEQLTSMSYEDVVSPKLKSLRESFEKDIENLKIQSVGNKTRTALLNSIDDDVEFIIKGLVDESSLK